MGDGYYESLRHSPVLGNVELLKVLREPGAMQELEEDYAYREPVAAHPVMDAVMDTALGAADAMAIPNIDLPFDSWGREISKMTSAADQRRLAVDLERIKAIRDPDERAAAIEQIKASRQSRGLEPLDLSGMYGSEMLPEQVEAISAEAAALQPGMTPGDTPPGVGATMGGPEAPTGRSYTEQLYDEASEIGRAIQELAPEYAEKQKATLNTMRGVHKEQMEFINDSIKDQKKAFDEALTLRNDFERTRKELQETQRRAAVTTRAKLDGINTQIMNYEIDPNRAFKSVWQVVGAAVAAAAGAYAQGLSQGKIPNTALAIIDKAIDRDIHAQKMELGKLQTAADIQNNIYGRMLQEHGDERRAIAEARAAALGMAQLKLNELKATTASGLKARSIQLMELRLQQDWNKAAMTAERASMTAAYNGKLREIDLLQKAGTTGTASKLSVAQKIARVVPQFENLKQIWNKVDFGDAMSYMTKFGTLFGTEGAVKGAAEVKAYIQARNTTVKEIVQIFEGSKPSDLDWKVMVELLPDYWNKRSYGDAVITSFQEFLKAKGGTGLKEGDIARWALQSGRMNYDDIKGVPSDSIDKVKFDIGFKEE